MFNKKALSLLVVSLLLVSLVGTALAGPNNPMPASTDQGIWGLRCLGFLTRLDAASRPQMLEILIPTIERAGGKVTGITEDLRTELTPDLCKKVLDATTWSDGVDGEFLSALFTAAYVGSEGETYRLQGRYRDEDDFIAIFSTPFAKVEWRRLGGKNTDITNSLNFPGNYDVPYLVTATNAKGEKTYTIICMSETKWLEMLDRDQ